MTFPVFYDGGMILAHGASVLDDIDVAMAALPLDYAFNGNQAYLHVGMADGQDAYESGILYRTSMDLTGKIVTPASSFSGTDGPNWDDITFNLSSSGLKGYSGHLTISHDGSGTEPLLDCLGWVYAALKVTKYKFWISKDLYVSGRQESLLQELQEPIENLDLVEPWWLEGIPIEVPDFILEPIKLPPQPLPQPQKSQERR